jgi:AcrR family transcriptional regulator
MSQVAETLGVANAAVYWYFKTKDELLAEVWNRSLDEEIERLKNGPEDPFAQLIQGLIDLRAYRQLHMTVHERMINSEAVTAVHERLLDWVRDMVRDGITYHGGDPAVEDDLVELVVVVFEGTNVPGVSTRTATDLVSTILQRVRLQQGTTLGLPSVAMSAPTAT